MHYQRLKRHASLEQPRHFKSFSKEHYAWSSIKQRCLNPNNSGYKNYGGRGITICDEWKNDFKAFYRAVGDAPTFQHSIERINNNGNYEPGNVKWATKEEQANNRRGNNLITIEGVTKTFSQWVKESNLKYSTVWERYNSRSWPIKKAIGKD
jgi:hypothetical protein